MKKRMSYYKLCNKHLIILNQLWLSKTPCGEARGMNKELAMFLKIFFSLNVLEYQTYKTTYVLQWLNYNRMCSMSSCLQFSIYTSCTVMYFDGTYVSWPAIMNVSEQLNISSQWRSLIHQFENSSNLNSFTPPSINDSTLLFQVIYNINSIDSTLMLQHVLFGCLEVRLIIQNCILFKLYEFIYYALPSTFMNTWIRLLIPIFLYLIRIFKGTLWINDDNDLISNVFIVCKHFQFPFNGI